MREELVQFEGVVTSKFKNACRVSLNNNNGREVLAEISGRMMLNKIQVVPGDRVTVEISPYDLRRGRIVFRQR